MKTIYDRDTVVPITREFRDSLYDLMIAQCHMVEHAEPGYADCWQWGLCTIGDLAYQHLEFEYGGMEDAPKEIQEQVSKLDIPFLVQVDEEIQKRVKELEKESLISIAKKAIEKNMDYEELYYSDYFYGKEDQTESVWEYVVECREIGTKTFYEKYK